MGRQRQLALTFRCLSILPLGAIVASHQFRPWSKPEITRHTDGVDEEVVGTTRTRGLQAITRHLRCVGATRRSNLKRGRKRFELRVRDRLAADPESLTRGILQFESVHVCIRVIKKEKRGVALITGSTRKRKPGGQLSVTGTTVCTNSKPG